MAGALEEAEAFEQATNHVVELLNQVDQKLKESKSTLERLYAGAPAKSQARVQKVKDAIAEVESVLTQMVMQHNSVVADVQGMKEEIKEHESADLGY
jgi:chromosome segregation ATPase